MPVDPESFEQYPFTIIISSCIFPIIKILS